MSAVEAIIGVTTRLADLIIVAAVSSAESTFIKGVKLMRKKLFSKGTKTPTVLGALEGPDQGSMRDLSTWSLSTFSQLPHTFIWAMLRSGRGSPSADEEAKTLKALFAAMEGRLNFSCLNLLFWFTGGSAPILRSR